VEDTLGDETVTGQLVGGRGLDLPDVMDSSGWPHRLEILLWHLPEAIILVDVSGEILRINATARTLLGDPTGERTTVEDLEPERQRGRLRRRLERAMTAPAADQPVMLVGHGSRLLADLGIMVVRDDLGGVAGWVVTIHDVTPRLLSAATAGAMDPELDPQQTTAAVAGVLRETVDFDHLLLDVVEGDAVRRIGSVGLLEHELPQGLRFPISDEPLRQLLDEPVVVQHAAADDRLHSQRLAKAGVGSYLMVPVTQAGELIAVLALCHRLPHRVASGQARRLQVVTEPLATAVRSLLLFEREREAIVRLEAIDELRRDLVSMVAHDLQNPLAAIAGWTAIVRDRWSELQDAQKLELVSLAARRSCELGTLVAQTLDVSQVEAGKLAYGSESFDLRELLGRAIVDLGPFANSVAFQLETPDDPVHVLADRMRQSQVLMNVLSNAVKYSDPHSMITACIDEHAGAARVRISNPGRELSSEDLEQMFGRHQRIGDTQRLAPAKGTGLGLYLSRMMVEGQGGRIWAENRDGGGITITWTVPLADRA